MDIWSFVLILNFDLVITAAVVWNFYLSPHSYLPERWRRLERRAKVINDLARFRNFESSNKNKNIKVLKEYLFEVAGKFYKWPSHLPQ